MSGGGREDRDGAVAGHIGDDQIGDRLVGTQIEA